MKRPLISYVCGSVLIAGLFLAGGWAYWEAQPQRDGWVLLDPSERILSDVSPGQDIQVAFRLNNMSRRSYRILGASAC